MTDSHTRHGLGGEPSRQPVDELQAWLDWGRGLALMGDAFSRLLRAELRLALVDARRLALVTALVVPVAVFAWLGLSVLIAWLGYLASDMVVLGIATFLLVQCVALLAMRWLTRRYVRSLGLPHTRAHLRAVMEGFEQYGTQGTRRPDTAG